MQRSLPLILLLLLLTGLAYWPGLSGGFLFDDYTNIVDNSKVQPEHLDLAALTRAAQVFERGTIGRPLATIGFAVDYLIGGMHPWVFKLHSLLVHLLNTLLVFLLVRRLLTLPRAAVPHASTGAAFAIALLWAIHPLQVSTVLYIVQIMEMLAATFMLLGLLAYLRGRIRQIEGKRGWPWIAAAVACMPIGLLAKETAVLLPVFTLALELTVLGFAAATPRTQRVLRIGYGVGALLAVIVFFAFIIPHYAAPGAYNFRDFSLGERLLTQLRVLPMYLGQILLPIPSHMTFYYDNYSVSHGLLNPATTLAGGLLLAALTASAVYWRKRLPLYAFGILLFFGAHFLTSNVVPLELVYEHRNYLALLGILLALADLVRRLPVRDGPAIVRAGVVVVILGCGSLTLLRAATWGDPFLLAYDLAAINPDSPRASNGLAIIYSAMADGNADSPFYAMAMQEFERNARLPGSSPIAEENLILTAAAAGQPVQQAWWDSLLHKLQTNPIGGEESMAVQGFVSGSKKVGLDPHMVARSYTILESRVDDLPAPTLAAFGDHALTYLKDEKLANHFFLAATEQSDRDYVIKMASILLGEGHIAQATLVLEKAYQLGIVTSPTLEEVRSPPLENTTAP